MPRSVWFILLCASLVFVSVFGRDCSDIDSLKNCNECIRCGGHWCNKPKLGKTHCTSELYENWCSDAQEALRVTDDVTVHGNGSVSPLFSEKSTAITVPNRLAVTYKSAVELKTNITIVNTTQGFDISINKRSRCSGNECTVTIETWAGKDFCSPLGRHSESFSIKMNIAGMEDDVDMKYNVACACECSQQVDRNSSVCNYRGDFSCGVCSCRNGWSGEFCEEKVCKVNRGDIQCTNPARYNVECSGNGYCGPCETCECYTDKPGFQYFDKDNYCADLCMITNECDTCLRNPSLEEPCYECSMPVVFTAFNETFLENRDEFDRHVWVTCNETLFDDCHVEYAAKRENDEIVVMIMTFCEATAAPAVISSVRITVPVILGIIGFLAASAAAAGYIVWKNRSPPLPLTDPQYQNIGAEDCTGENPLYKPPTSSFKNPTYGKW